MARNDLVGGTVHETPSDLETLLSSDLKALAIWKSLTPLARNEYFIQKKYLAT
jgi:hypothetical protein